MKKSLLPLTILACLSSAILGAHASNHVEGAKPNIIYILADDLGYGDLSIYGQKRFKTPHIDKLARTGMRFLQHYSGSTVCAPSRSCLMSGHHTGNTPIRGNAPYGDEGQAPMSADTYTMAEMFQDAGYTTGLFGKWGLGAPETEGEPIKQGFDRFYGFNCQRLAHHYYPYHLWDDDQRIMLWGNVGMERGDYAPDLIQEQALEFIRDNKDKPFFMYYARIEPHAEMFAPEEYMEKYRGKFLPESNYEGTDSGPTFRLYPYGSQPEAHAAFAGMVNLMDDDVGEIVAELKKLGIYKNTILCFSSDNGPHQEGGHDPDYFDSTASLRGYKRDLYEGGVRVPFIVSWPGKIKANTETDFLCAFWDIFPTFAEIAGGPIPAHVDGVSIVPTLMGNDAQQAQHDYLYWEFHEKDGRVAARKGDWKAVRYNVANDPDGPLELYNLSDDAREERNIADQHPEVLAQMERIIASARTEHEDALFNFPTTRERARALSESASAHEK